MMLPGVEAIIFDVNGTLRTAQKRAPQEKLAYIQKICGLLGSAIPAGQMLALLEQRVGAYRTWSLESRQGLCEADLWAQWLLPDWPEEQVRKLAVPLNQAWRDAQAVRTPFPEVRRVILELFRRGYHLGIASNTIASTEVPQMLKDLGLAGYIEGMALSCQVNSRKPEPGLLLAACAEMGIPAQRCVYIANKAAVDVPAARRAGFAGVILRRGPDPLALEGELADGVISSLEELLDLFPGVRKPEESDFSLPAPRASLSTMWAIQNFDCLEDFWQCAQRMGFAQIELNHQVTPPMLEGFQLIPGRVSSVHEPCPASISTAVQTERDWLISSEDEANRQRGVAAIQRSIELAHRLQAGVVVVHCGNVEAERALEDQLAALYRDGQASSPQSRRLRETMRTVRRKKVSPRLRAVKASLRELLAFAAPLGVCLGLENRYHYMDIPDPDELGELLSLAAPEQLGFVLDTGHAAALDRLGFYPQEVWLQRFGERLVGMHLHDIKDLSDHRAPGSGSLDFSVFQHALPDFGFQTLELAPRQTFSQVKTGLTYLLLKGLLLHS
jgi:sugar phosphate isomerase/epimerase/FMN phosphatase YigB (HAD superfamily)